MRILAIDPGDKRIGIAISDPQRIIASPLCVIEHKKRSEDAKTILAYANEYGVELIVIGATFDNDGNLTPQGRKASRLAYEISTNTSISVELWDESMSTYSAKASRYDMNVKKSKRKGHFDAIAATIILQTYLEHHK